MNSPMTEDCKACQGLHSIHTHMKRRPGRQHISFLTYVQRLLGDDEGILQPSQISTLAQDRRSWKKLVVPCSAAEG